MKKHTILMLISLLLVIGAGIILFVIWFNNKSAIIVQQTEVPKTETYIHENDEIPQFEDVETEMIDDISVEMESFNYFDIDEYTGAAVQIVNDNIPFFSQEEKQERQSFEKYSDLDDLGRCGEAYACISKETLPTAERESIGSVKPSGWHTIKYDFIDGNYLYNRCHLIGYQISGENALETNLITGTRYLNVEGMLPYENLISEYVSNTNNHVLYRVTPYFQGQNLVANGVLMEAISIEDEGKGICFCVFAYNVQPGVIIDYLTGDSEKDTGFIVLDNIENDTLSERKITESAGDNTGENLEASYIGNKNSHRFHYPYCESVKDMKDKNKVYFYGDRNEPIEAGYAPCGSCNP